MYEIEKGRPHGKLRGSQESEARDRVGKAIGMSGRNLCRYFRLLMTPVEVQNSVRVGKLALVAAEKVADLKAEVQQEVAGRIRGGEPPKVVLLDYLPQPDKKHRKVGDALASFARDVQRGVEDLHGRLGEVRNGHVQRYVDVLKRAKSLIRRLLEIASPPETDD